MDEKNLKRVLVVGAGEAGNSIIKEISGSRFVNMHIVGLWMMIKAKLENICMVSKSLEIEMIS